MSLNRRMLLSLGATAAFVAASGGGSLAQSAEPTKIRVAVVKMLNLSTVHAAKALGYFDAVGLDVELVFVRSGAEGLAGVIGGSAHFAGVNTVSFLHSRAQGLPIIGVADGGRASKTAPAAYAIIARSDDNITEGGQLENKTVAVVSRKSLQELHFNRWAKLQGFDPSKVRLIEMGFAQMEDAVVSGQLDAALIAEPFLTHSLADERIKLLSYFSVEAEPGHAATMWAGNEDWVRENEAAARNFVYAMYRAHEYLNSNKQEAHRYSAEFTGLDIELFDKMAADVLHVDLDATSLQIQADMMKDLGWVDQPINVEASLWRRK